MIQIQSKLKINDNSGIKTGQCIKIYKTDIGSIGNVILISVKKFRSSIHTKKKLTKGDLFKALIIHTRYNTLSTIGNMIKFDRNCIIILTNQNKPLGTRIFGPITRIFRKKKQFKILSLASHIL